jgi:predicted aspartyl protease
MARKVLSRVGLTVQDKGIYIEAVFDTGATRSFVNLQLAEKLGYVRYDSPREVLLATKDKKAPMVGELIARVKILGYELPLSHVFGVIEALDHDTIIGMDVMGPYEILVDAKEGKVSFKRFPPTIEII